MRDRTRSRSYSAAGDQFRREHERHREWGLVQRHARKLRRLHALSSGSPVQVPAPRPSQPTDPSVPSSARGPSEPSGPSGPFGSSEPSEPSEPSERRESAESQVASSRPRQGVKSASCLQDRNARSAPAVPQVPVPEGQAWSSVVCGADRDRSSDPQSKMLPAEQRPEPEGEPERRAGCRRNAD